VRCAKIATAGGTLMEPLYQHKVGLERLCYSQQASSHNTGNFSEKLGFTQAGFSSKHGQGHISTKLLAALFFPREGGTF